MKLINPKEAAILASLFILGIFLGLNFSLPDLPSGGHEKPNIIIIDIDRMAESHMSCYGYRRNTTPNMCRFGEENIMVENAISHSGWTGSSLASLFTGQYVGTHDVEVFNDTLGNESRTMAEVFKDNGYNTIAFPSIPVPHQKFMIREYNLDQGFERYIIGNYALPDHRIGVENYIDTNNDEPFFLFIQSYRPHDYLPFNKTFRDTRFQKENYSGVLNDVPPRAKRQMATDIILRDGQYQIMVPRGKNVNLTERDIEHLNATYDDLLYDTDQAFGYLLQSLKEKEVYSESIIILTANHGEVMDTMSFSGNERFGHGVVYEDQVNVPFMMHVPEQERSLRIERQVEFVDIFPTLLELTDTEFGDGRELMLQGESFAHLIRNDSGFLGLEGESENRIRKGEMTVISDYGYKIHALRNNTWKYIRLNPGHEQLFNLKKDPKEHHNVADEYPEFVDNLSRKLDQKQQRNQLLHSKIYG